MKKTVIFLIAFIMLLLGGCDTAREENERGVDVNRSFIHYNTFVLSTETQETIFFAGWQDYFIKFVDKETGIGGVLCGKPECAHNDKNCNAYMTTYARGLFVEGERLYWVNLEKKDSYGCVVYSAALDGTDRRVDAQIPREYIPTNSGYINVILKDGYLYFGCVKSIVEDGVDKDFNYVFAFPLIGDQEPLVILEERAENSQTNGVPMQVYGDSLYFITSDLDDSATQADLYNVQLRQYDMNSGELETLYQIDRTDMHRMTELWVLDDGVIFCGYGNDYMSIGIYKFYFESGECVRIFENPEMFVNKTAAPTWTGIADNLVTSYGITNNDGVYDFDVVIKNFDGTVLVNGTYELDLRQECAFYGSHFVFLLGRDEENAYYAFTAPPYAAGYSYSDKGISNVTTIIQVALDGSGARVMCTQEEYIEFSA